jgi:hypothetical protein
MDHSLADVAARAPGIRLSSLTPAASRRRAGGAFIAVLLIAACGGGGGDSTPAPPLVLQLPAGRISVASPLAAGCTGGSATGSFFVNAEVEPFVVADPANANHSSPPGSRIAGPMAGRARS